MRILVVNYEYPPLGGGGGVVSKALVGALAPRHDVVVLTSRSLDLPAESFEQGARILRVPMPGRRDPQRARVPWLAMFPYAARPTAARLLRRWKPDVVHTFFAVPSGPAGTWIARRARVPHVLTLAGADVHDPTRRASPDRFRPVGAVVRRVARRSDVVVAVSRDLAERAGPITGRDDILTVPNTIEETPLPPPDRAGLGWSREMVLVTTARLVKRKGYDTLLAALPSVDASVRLEIVGDGPERTALETLARGLPHPVVFAGAVSAAERDLRLVSADAFVLTSLHEAFGLVILEAMRAGLPVISTDCGGPRDLVRDGETGFLVPVGDEITLAERISRLAKDPALRSRMGAAGKQAAADLTPAKIAARYEEIYERARAARR